MKEIRDIIKAYDAAVISGKQSVLATVVKVEGSSYRREGARMLITDDGRLTGAISGGCLEGDALRKALLVIQSGLPALVTYDTTDDDDAKLGLGLGCNGIIHILIEPINPSVINAIDLLKAAVAERCTSVLVTFFSLDDRKNAQQGSRFLLNEHEQLQIPTQPPLTAALILKAQNVLQTGVSFIENQNEITVFIEVLKPSIALIIFGAGNDAMPLVQMAAVLGWQITVIDGRPSYATSARFPLANRVIVSKPEDALAQVDPDPQTAIVLMTHNYNYDIAILKQALVFTAPYIGVLGPKKKLERMIDELNESGIHIANEDLQKVYGPTGLDIGASTPEEIALSILAEIQSVLSLKSANSLRERSLPIHSLLQ